MEWKITTTSNNQHNPHQNSKMGELIFPIIRARLGVLSLAVLFLPSIAFVVKPFASCDTPNECAQSLNEHTNSPVHVYDNVLPIDSRESLHSAAKKSGLGHKVFTRPLINPRSEYPIIEQALDSILTEIGDDVDDSNLQHVEYWTRQEWRHIEAHADVDEHLAKEQDIAISKGELDANQVEFRYPENGHVLYLKVGSSVQGPTCVFPNKSSGSDLVKGQETEVVVVPAVDGRLLRFQGDLLHAVPRPADLYFLSFVKGSQSFEPEEEWGRSVILFNTWRDDAPKGVETSIEEADKVRNIVNRREEWKNAYPIPQSINEDDSTCESSTNDHNIDKDDAMAKVKIWLLGNDRRRGHPMRTVQMKGKLEHKEAFLERSNVSSITISS